MFSCLGAPARELLTGFDIGGRDRLQKTAVIHDLEHPSDWAKLSDFVGVTSQLLSSYFTKSAYQQLTGSY
jgi:hypothetical protein